VIFISTDKQKLEKLGDRIITIFSSQLGLFEGTARGKLKGGISQLTDDEAANVVNEIKRIINEK
jgi:hypothetical protein